MPKNTAPDEGLRGIVIRRPRPLCFPGWGDQGHIFPLGLYSKSASWMMTNGFADLWNPRRTAALSLVFRLIHHFQGTGIRMAPFDVLQDVARSSTEPSSTIIISPCPSPEHGQDFHEEPPARLRPASRWRTSIAFHTPCSRIHRVEDEVADPPPGAPSFTTSAGG